MSASALLRNLSELCIATLTDSNGHPRDMRACPLHSYSISQILPASEPFLPRPRPLFFFQPLAASSCLQLRV